MRSFYYIRHGQTDWNVERRCQGQSDIPLNTTGIQQAQQAAQQLQSIAIDHIISSPLQRALTTAQHIAELKNMPVTVEENLQEASRGELEGQLIADTLKKYNFAKVQDAHRSTGLGVEPWDTLVARAGSTIKNGLSQYEGNVLFVGHGGFSRALAEALDTINPGLENCVPHIFRYQNGNYTIESLS